MTNTQLVLDHVNVNVVVDENIKPLLKDINLTIDEGEFVTVIGTNGAGKSTLFNSITGDLAVSSGKVFLNGEDVTNKAPERRAKYLGHVFQDPKLGTAPRMTVAENLALAQNRGMHLGLGLRQIKAQLDKFIELTTKTGNNLEQAINKPTEQLSGGQRQALSLLMATIKLPNLLLLDEHTAALDPHTSQNIMELTNQIVTDNHLTTLMITHQMDDALKYGNRLLVLDQGEIIADIKGSEKAQLTKLKLLEYFA